MNVQEKFESTSMALGLYVHVPFCSSTCDFCPFYQEKPRKNSIKSYLSGLSLEFMRVLPPRLADTVFIGEGSQYLIVSVGHNLRKTFARLLWGGQWEQKIEKPQSGHYASD